MFENFVFPDGTAPQWDSVNWLQKTFMKWFNNERLKKILTFPVETVNLLNDGKNFVDNEWADFTAEMWAEGHSFFVYTSDSVDSLASCCFDGSQMTLTKLNDKVNYMSFKDVYDLYNESVKNKDNHFTIFHDGKWVDGTYLPAITDPEGKLVKNNACHLIIPQEVAGYKVVGVDDGAFYKSNYLSSVHLPEGLRRIGKDCFYECKFLSTVSLPSTIVSIGDNAFGNNTQLEDVYIHSTQWAESSCALEPTIICLGEA